MDKTDFLYLEAFTKKRYMHWTSAMRQEFLQGVMDLEKQIEAKYFPTFGDRQPDSDI